MQRLHSYPRPSYLFLDKKQYWWTDSSVKATCLCIVTFAEDVISVFVFSSFVGMAHTFDFWLNWGVSPNNRKTAMLCHVIVVSLMRMVVQLNCCGAKTMTTWLRSWVSGMLDSSQSEFVLYFHVTLTKTRQRWIPPYYDQWRDCLVMFILNCISSFTSTNWVAVFINAYRNTPLKSKLTFFSTHTCTFDFLWQNQIFSNAGIHHYTDDSCPSKLWSAPTASLPTPDIWRKVTCRTLDAQLTHPTSLPYNFPARN